MKRKKIFWWILTGLNMLAIFLFSAQTGQQSGEISGLVESIIAHIPQGELLVSLINIRKAAHFTVYLTLGICMYQSILLYPVRERLCFGMALGFCFIYACSDEWHQHFVPGRGPSFLDVGVDTAGAFTGMLLIRIRKSLLSKCS